MERLGREWALVLVALLTGALAGAFAGVWWARPDNAGSEIRAENLLKQRLQDSNVYPWAKDGIELVFNPVGQECSHAFEVRERHLPGSGKDPNVMPVVDRFVVNPDSGEIRWDSDSEDGFAPFSQLLIYRAGAQRVDCRDEVRFNGQPIERLSDYQTLLEQQLADWRQQARPQRRLNAMLRFGSRNADFAGKVKGLSLQSGSGQGCFRLSRLALDIALLMEEVLPLDTHPRCQKAYQDLNESYFASWRSPDQRVLDKPLMDWALQTLALRCQSPELVVPAPHDPSPSHESPLSPASGIFCRELRQHGR